MDKMIGDSEIDANTLATMRQRGGQWSAYQNAAMDSASLGHLQFLQYGPGRTFREPPVSMPDTQAGLGWKYRHVGFVDLASGKVVATEPVKGVSHAQAT